MSNRAVVIDVEATGLTDDAQSTEIGWCDVAFSQDGILQPTTKAFVQRCLPETQVSYGSMAITGIYPEELVGMPSHSEVIPSVLDDSITYLIGHNIDYDVMVTKNSGVDRDYKLICTLALARAFYPQEPDHKLGTILHMLDYDFAREHYRNAHSAKYDVMFCVRILRIMCANNGITDMEQLYQISEQSRIPVFATFGMHKGKHIANEVPYAYKTHMLTKDDLDKYVRIAFEKSVADTDAARAELKERQKADRQATKLAKAANEAKVLDEKKLQPDMIPADNNQSLTTQAL